MTELRSDLPPLPPRMAHLAVSKAGYPVPWFATWINGEPNFRQITRQKIADAHNHKLCWLCGSPLGRYIAFNIGPMCAINRISSEPPSHRECAEFAAIACPFLSRPKARRRDQDIGTLEDHTAGFGISRNPGCSLVWVARTYSLQ